MKGRYEIYESINGYDNSSRDKWMSIESFFITSNYISAMNNGQKLYKQYSHLGSIHFLKGLESDVANTQSPNFSVYKKRLDEHWQHFRFDFV